jgi:RNA polymerase sigma factor (sigma-70 family)
MYTAPHDSVLRYIRRLAAGRELQAQSDQDLLDAFAARHEEAAFAALVCRHGPMVLRVCRRVLGHEQDTEDAFQATFLVLARCSKTIRKRAALAEWLHGVAYRTALSARRRAARRQRREKDLPDVQARLQHISFASVLDPVPSATLTWTEVQAVLDEELRRLAKRFRQAFVLCVLEGKSETEAAALVGCKKGTLSSRLARARQQLRQRLGRRGIDLSALFAALAIAEGSAPALAPSLTQTAVKYGLLATAGASAAARIPAQVCALAEGVSAALLSTKIKLASIVVLITGLLATGAGVVAQQARTMLQPPAANKQSEVIADKSRPAGPSAHGAQDKPDRMEVKGRVVDGGGKPVAAARVYLWTAASPTKGNLPVRATTAADGAFRFSAMRRELQGEAKILATAAEYGPDWAPLAGNKNADVNLRLVRDDVPIRGRILSLEGQPVAEATIEVAGIDQGQNGELASWFREKKRYAYFQLKYLSGKALDSPTLVHTGPDGRFHLAGFGRDRVVYLRITGPRVENSFIYVITSAGAELIKKLGSRDVFPAQFDFVIAPSRPVMGTVRDKASGKPLAGVTVTWLNRDRSQATTDADGRYHLEGVGRYEEQGFAAERMPYFNLTRFIPESPGAEPLTVDFELERGIVLTGRLIDKVTGKPVQGRVSYMALANNPHAKDYQAIRETHFYPGDWGHTRADGSFTVLAIPGPGLLCVQADDAGKYLRARNTEGWRFALPLTPIMEQYHAITPIEIGEKSTQHSVGDIALEHGRSLHAIVVGHDGQPLSGARVVGRRDVMEDVFRMGDPLDTSRFLIGALAPGTPRTIVALHVEKKLGKVQPVRSDDKEPITVRLEPLAGLTGQILDATGRPRAGLTVRADMRFNEEDRKHLPCAFLLRGTWGKLIDGKTTTDEMGHFRMDGLVPGLIYVLQVENGADTPSRFPREVSLEPGKTKDLGGLTLIP